MPRIQKKLTTNIIKTMTNHVTLKQAAEQFGCAVSTLRNWAKKGRLPSTQKGGKNSARMVDPENVASLLKEATSVKSVYTPETGDYTSDIKDQGSPIDEEASQKKKSSAKASGEKIEKQAGKVCNEQVPDAESRQCGSGMVYSSPHKRRSATKHGSKSKKRPPNLSLVHNLAKQLPVADQLKLTNRLRRQMEEVY